jgi:hypothetical protein
MKGQSIYVDILEMYTLQERNIETLSQIGIEVSVITAKWDMSHISFDPTSYHFQADQLIALTALKPPGKYSCL